MLDKVEGEVVEVDTSNIGLRYDQANNRWVRDNRPEAQTNLE